MTKITISAETLDALTIDGLRSIREQCTSEASTHPHDIAADKMRVAACDLLLDYLGAK